MGYYAVYYDNMYINTTHKIILTLHENITLMAMHSSSLENHDPKHDCPAATNCNEICKKPFNFKEIRPRK